MYNCVIVYDNVMKLKDMTKTKIQYDNFERKNI